MSFADISQVLSNLNLLELGSDKYDDVTPLNVGGFEITYDLSRGFNRSDNSTNWLDSDKRNKLLSLQNTKKMLTPYWGGSYNDNDAGNAVYIKNLMIKVNDEVTDVAGYPKYKDASYYLDNDGTYRTAAEALEVAHDRTQTPVDVNGDGELLKTDPRLLSHVSLPYVGTFYLCRYRSLINNPTYWRLVRSDVLPSSASSDGVTIIEGRVNDDGITLEFVAPSTPDSTPENTDPVLHQAEKAAIFEGAAIQYPGGYSGLNLHLPFANNIGFRMRDVTDGSFLSSLSTIGDGFMTNLNPIVVPNAPDLPVATGQSVTCGANTTGITPKQTSITLPSGFQSYTVVTGTGPSNGSLSGTAPNLTYTPNDDFVGDDSFTFTVNDGTNESLPATVSITVLPTLKFVKTTYTDSSTILYDPSDLSASLDISQIPVGGKHIVQGNQTIITTGDFTSHIYDPSDESTWSMPVQTMLLHAAVVQGTEYEMSFIYSVDKGKAKINLYTDAWTFGYKYIDHNDLGSHEDANQNEQTFTKTFTANATKTDMRIDIQHKFTDATATVTIKNFIVQEVAAARKTKMRAPLALNQDGLAIGQAFENAKTAFAATITAAADKKVARRDALDGMFVNTSGLLKIKMTRTELGISDQKLKRENVVVVKAGETIDVSAVNSVDESFYCPLANDGDEITLTKGDGSLTVKRQDAGVPWNDEKHIITTASNVASITKGASSYTTPAELGELVEDDVITVTFTDGNTIIFFIGSVGDGSETESSGASGDPFLVTLL